MHVWRLSGLVIVSAALMGETITALEAVGYSGLLFFFGMCDGGHFSWLHRGARRTVCAAGWTRLCVGHVSGTHYFPCTFPVLSLTRVRYTVVKAEEAARKAAEAASGKVSAVEEPAARRNGVNGSGADAALPLIAPRASATSLSEEDSS